MRSASVAATRPEAGHMWQPTCNPADIRLFPVDKPTTQSQPRPKVEPSRPWLPLRPPQLYHCHRQRLPQGQHISTSAIHSNQDRELHHIAIHDQSKVSHRIMHRNGRRSQKIYCWANGNPTISGRLLSSRAHSWA
jgi:hypothetical protein